jgi:hypothetical protein
VADDDPPPRQPARPGPAPGGANNALVLILGAVVIVLVVVVVLLAVAAVVAESVARQQTTARVADEVRATLEGLPKGRAFQCSPPFSALAGRLAAVWLGLPGVDNAFLSLFRSLALVSVDSEQWKTVQRVVEKSGVVPELQREGLLPSEETLEFVRRCCQPLFALPSVVGNTLAALDDRPEVIERVRSDPSLIRPAIDEALRLTPISLGIKRRMTRPLAIAGLDLPVGCVVDLLVGSANRDPDAFPDADMFSVDRRSPPPFILEDDGARFSRLDDEPRQGCEHLVLDVAALVLGSMLAEPWQTRVDPIRGMRILPQRNGNCVQAPMGVRLVWERASPA